MTPSCFARTSGAAASGGAEAVPAPIPALAPLAPPWCVGAASAVLVVVVGVSSSLASFVLAWSMWSTGQHQTYTGIGTGVGTSITIYSVLVVSAAATAADVAAASATVAVDATGVGAASAK